MVPVARGFRWLGPPQHGTQGRVAQRLAQHSVGPEGGHDPGRVGRLPPQPFDQPFGLGPQALGLAARLVARLERRLSQRRTVKSPEPDASVVPSGLKASDQT
jgi:hypothetical protein